MKHTIVFICLSQLIPVALSVNPNLGSLRAVFLWYAYRADVVANGSTGARTIAPGCRGTVGDGSCYFDEFLEYIQSDDGPKWDGETEIEDNLTPDVRTAANELVITDYNMDLDMSKLFADGDPGEVPNLNELFDKITSIIQTIRLQGGDEAISAELQGLRTTQTGISQEITRSLNSYMISGLREFAQAAGYDWVRLTCKGRHVHALSWPLRRNWPVIFSVANYAHEQNVPTRSFSSPVVGIFDVLDTDNWYARIPQALWGESQSVWATFLREFRPTNEYQIFISTAAWAQDIESQLMVCPCCGFLAK